MTHSRTLSTRILLLALTVLGLQQSARAQADLEKKLSLSIRQRSLTQTLTDIGRKGGFIFSYNTTILNGDSLVDVHADHLSVREILDRLLGPGYEYSPNGKYIIILQRPPPPPEAPPIRLYTISGYIKDEGTKEKLSNVSVYESGQLVSTLTDTNGFFRLRLSQRERVTTAMVVVSKQFYRDTILFIRSGYDREFTLDISREKVADLTPFVVTHRVEKTWLGRILLSSRAVVQSLNIVNYLADKPVQMSLTPGLGTHGRMGAQVVNKVSLNIIGGYTFGMNGVELAGVFNIDRKDVSGVQAAGIVNVVGGKVRGVQLAGIHNHNLDSMKGVQAAGVSNLVQGNFAGVQLAGTVNVVRERTDGVQVSGLVNYTKKLRGVQIGVINLADTSSGFMFGLVNIVKHGRHQLTLSSNEMLPVILSYRSGGRKLYNILLFGYDPGRNEKTYAYGFGIGNEWTFSRHLALNTEVLENTLLVGHGRELPQVLRLQMLFNVKLAKGLSIFAGPAFSVAWPGPTAEPDGYKTILPRSGYNTFTLGCNARSWIGVTAGVSIF